MSRDQRPGKLKLVGSGTTVPARRRGDRVPVARPAVSSAPAVKSEPVRRRASGLLLSLLFLVAAGAAGTGVALLGTIPR